MKVKTNKNVDIKTTIVITDKYSDEKIINKKEEYVKPEYEQIDRVIKKIVYDTLNKYIAPKFDDYVHLLKVKPKRIVDLVVITPSMIREIKDTILTNYPTITSLIDELLLELTIMHYVTRYLYDLAEEFNKYVNDKKINLRKNRRYFILTNMYKVLFKVLKVARGFLFQQAHHLITFNMRSLRNIMDFMYKYSDIDEDDIIMHIINTFCGNMIYKVNFLKSENIAAVIKSLYRAPLGYFMSRKIGKRIGEDEESFDSDYRVVVDQGDLENINLHNKFTFLISMLETTYEIDNNYLINSQPIFRKYQADVIKQTYNTYNKVAINIFRLISYHLLYKNKESYDLFNHIYNDLSELLKVSIVDNTINTLKQKYPELYRFIKSIVLKIDNTHDKNITKKDLLFTISISKLSNYISTKLQFEFGHLFNKEQIDELSKKLARYTYNYIKSHIFINPVSNTPVIPIDEKQFYKDIANLYVDFITSK